MDVEEFADLTPAKLLRERFELENALGCARSPMGNQLDAAKVGNLGPGHTGAGRDPDEGKRLRLLTLLTFCRDLSRQQVVAARLYYDKLLEPEQVERNVRLADMQEGDGDEIIDTKPTAPDGKPLAGYVRVRGITLRNPSHEAVAAQMAKDGELTSDDKPMTAAAVSLSRTATSERPARLFTTPRHTR